MRKLFGKGNLRAAIEVLDFRSNAILVSQDEVVPMVEAFNEDVDDFIASVMAVANYLTMLAEQKPKKRRHKRA